MRSINAAIFALWLVAGNALAAEFMPGIAVTDAGRLADPGKKKFFAYYITSEATVQSMTADVAKSLADTANIKANLAIFGPDYELNTKVLNGALQAAPKGSLNGVTILYVGGTEEVEGLKASAEPSGAVFRATTYSGR